MHVDLTITKLRETATRKQQYTYPLQGIKTSKVYSGMAVDVANS